MRASVKAVAVERKKELDSRCLEGTTGVGGPK